MAKKNNQRPSSSFFYTYIKGFGISIPEQKKISTNHFLHNNILIRLVLIIFK